MTKNFNQKEFKLLKPKSLLVGLTYFLLISATLVFYQNCGSPFDAQQVLTSHDESSQEFTCENPSTVGASRSVRLSKSQYINSLEDVFGAPIIDSVRDQLALLPNDDDRYNSSALGDISSTHIEAYMNVALGLADSILRSPTLITKFFGSCATGATPTSACIDTYLNGTARRIFRRPLTKDEVTEAKSIVNSTGIYSSNLRRLLALHLQSPSFLLLTELGDGEATDGIIHLTDYEVATRIAYAATNSLPDEELLNAARDGRLATTAEISKQVLRLFQKPKGKTQIRRMFRYWLDQVGGIDISQLPEELKEGVETNGLNTAAFTEQDAFIDYLIWEKNAGFKELLTSKVSLATHTGLAQIYGHPPISEERGVGDKTQEFSGRRQGILMRLSFLASSKPRTNVVSRGVRIRRQVLCEELPSPTGAAVSEREDLEPSETLRNTMATSTYITHLTNSSTCLSCHSKINPTGISFEGLDPLGRIRHQEALFDQNGAFIRKVPVQTAGQVPLWGQLQTQIADAYDLISIVSSSPKGTACFARQTFRFFRHRKDSNEDTCELKAIHNELTKAHPSIRDAFVAAIANNASKLRRTR